VKQNLIIGIILFMISCVSQKDETRIRHENKETLTPMQSSIIFYDNDSINNQSFKTVSRVKNDSLFWKIDFIENNEVTQEKTDSIRGLSYLVKAVDLNNDSIGELVFVTGYFKKGSDSNEYLKCRVFCYIKERNQWICQELPSPIDNPQSDNSSEVVEVGKKFIIRKIQNKNGIPQSIFYGLNKNGKFFIR
jgi:hypothetical protein